MIAPPLPLPRERPQVYLFDERDARRALLAAVARVPHSQQFVAGRDGIIRLASVVWLDDIVVALDGRRFDVDPESVADLVWLVAEAGLGEKVTLDEHDRFVVDDNAGANAIVGIILRTAIHEMLVHLAPVDADELLHAGDEERDEERRAQRPVLLDGILADAVVATFRQALASTPAPDLALRLLYRQAQRDGLTAADAQLLLERAHRGARELLAHETPERVAQMRRDFLRAVVGLDAEDAASTAVMHLVLRARVEQMMVAGEEIPDSLQPVAADIRATRREPEERAVLDRHTPRAWISLDDVREQMRAAARSKKRSRTPDTQLVGFAIAALLDGEDVALRVDGEIITDSMGHHMDAARSIEVAMRTVGARVGMSVPWHAVLEIARRSIAVSATPEVPFDALAARARRAYVAGQAYAVRVDRERLAGLDDRLDERARLLAALQPPSSTFTREPLTREELLSMIKDPAPAPALPSTREELLALLSKKDKQ